MAEEILKKVNLFGQDYILKGSGGAAGGTGGGGLALTGGAYVGAEGGITSTNRWLRFDFNDPSHKSLVILGGTSFTIGENIVTIDETTSYNLSDYISEEGADYYVFINAEGRVIASTIRTPAEGYMFIGQFHTLCNGVPTNTTAQFPTNISTTGESVTLCDYFLNQDLDFATFYTKTIDANNTGSYYNFATILHPLQGFNTGDILPESVWCLNFHPACKNWDGMVYCNSGKIAVDIYLQSGTGSETRSEYGAVHTVSRQCVNHECDMHTIGKSLLTHFKFLQIALGSNEKSAIQGASDKSTVGGHVDTAGRRMISFIGCEECCGYLLQWNMNESVFENLSSWTVDDGRGLMGQSQTYTSTIRSGGYWYGSSNCGSRCIVGDSTWSNTYTWNGARGCCDISIV